MFHSHDERDVNIFRVVAPMEDGVAAIALFNFTESGKTLKSGFTAKDYSHAGELLPNGSAWPTPAEGLLVYHREAQSIAELGDGFSTEVSNFGAKLFFLYPKVKGWAVIGRAYRRPVSTSIRHGRAPSRLFLPLSVTGPFVFPLIPELLDESMIG